MSSAASRVVRSSSLSAERDGLRRGHRRDARLQARRLRRGPEDPVLEIERREVIAVGDQRLRFPEHEHARGTQREVQVAQDALLGLRVEVDQRVAAHQQVQARDRRVVDQVVAPEDQRSAHVLAQRVALVDALEVALPQLRRHAFDLPAGELRLARRTERVLVDVGRVDLHALAVLLRAEELREQHGDGHGLLARGAAGAPHPHGLVGRLGGQDLRQDLRLQVGPHGRIAEELRDVDEQRVEQQLELVRVDLEVVEVGAEVLAADRLHAPPEAPLEARLLVAGEVEAARSLEELQQRRERAVGAHVATASRSSSSGSRTPRNSSARRIADATRSR